MRYFFCAHNNEFALIFAIELNLITLISDTYGMAGAAFLPKTLMRASLGDRIVAMTLDSLVLFTLFYLLFITVPAFAEVLSVIVFYSYFIISHKVFYKTFGKHSMGLFIITQKTRELSWSQVIVRETLWRSLSSLLFFYEFWRFTLGYPLSLDAQSGTIVAKYKNEKRNFLRSLVVSSVVFLFSGVLVYIIVVRSALLGHVVSRILEQNGHVIIGLKGSPRQGWSVDYWSGVTPYGRFELRGITINYNLSSLYSDGRIMLNEIHISKALWKYNRPSMIINDETLSAYSQFFQWGQRSINKYIVGRFAIADMRIARQGLPDLVTQKFYMNSIHLTDKKLFFDKLFLESPVLRVHLWNTVFDRFADDVSLESSFILRKGLHPSINGDINAKLIYKGNLKSPKYLNAMVFDKSLKIIFENNLFSVFAQNFNPRSFLNYKSEISEISGNFKSKPCKTFICVPSEHSSGSFKHFHKKIVYQGTTARIDGTIHKVKMDLYSLFYNMFDPAPLFQMQTSDDHQSLLSRVYFGKNFELLSPAERSALSRIEFDYNVNDSTTINRHPTSTIPSLLQFNQ